MKNAAKFLFLTLVGIFFLIGLGHAADNEYTITIENHQFQPASLTVPANVKVKLIIVNNDETSEEFESYDLDREKIVQGKDKITVFIGPLKPGKYTYFGEFNPDTAQGEIIVQ